MSEASEASTLLESILKAGPKAAESFCAMVDRFVANGDHVSKAERVASQAAKDIFTRGG
jgi:hypothetical protein